MIASYSICCSSSFSNNSLISFKLACTSAETAAILNFERKFKFYFHEKIALKNGYVIIRAARAVRITVCPACVLKYIKKYIYKILKHALDQKFKYLYYFGPVRVLDKIYSIY